MRIAIRGCGNAGKKLKNLITNYYTDDKVVYFVDVNSKLWGESFQSVPIVSQHKANMLYGKDEGFDKLLIPATLGSDNISGIINRAVEFGIKEDDIYVAPIEAIYGDDLDFYKQWNEVSQIRYLEYHICDYCNMNCKGCAHFSPISPKKMVNFEEIKKDLLRVKEIVSHIETIRILGGEPLLNPEVAKYIELTRNLYKYSEIRLVTNGILLRSLSDEIISSIINNNIIVDVSLYPPLYGTIDKIVVFLKEKGIAYRIIMEDSDLFSSSLNLSSTADYREKKKLCPHRCVNLRRGKITCCHMLAYIDIFNKFYGYELPISGAIDIYDSQLTAKAIRDKVMEAIPLCRYCDFSTSYKWEKSETPPNIEDWLV